MTIQELADEAGVTTRTIRYYVEQGVLPPPERGRPAEYTGEHVRLLHIVRRLKEQYLPLEEIRDMLQSLTVDQAEEFLRRTESPKQGPETQGSAADYISQVLSRGALRAQLKEQAPPSPAPMPPYQTEPFRPSPGVQPAPARSAGSTTPGDASTATHAQETAVKSYEQQGVLGSDTEKPQQSYIGEERTWQRVALAPGVELHYEVSTSGARPYAIQKLIEAARAILGHGLEKGTEQRK
jgi:DNA-binding transcriptional MerR regulator